MVIFIKSRRAKETFGRSSWTVVRPPNNMAHAYFFFCLRRAFFLAAAPFLSLGSDFTNAA